MKNLSDLREELEAKTQDDLFKEIADGAYDSQPNHLELAKLIYDEKVRRNAASNQNLLLTVARRAMKAAWVAAIVAIISCIAVIVNLFH